MERVVNYLDDFIIVAKTEEECLRQRNMLIETMEYFGFNISYSKVTEPSQVCVFPRHNDRFCEYGIVSTTS